MFNLIRNLVPDGLLRAMVLKTARQIASWASAAVVTYLLAHGASADDAGNIAAGLSAVLLGIASYGFSLWDAKSVDTKIKVAAQTGSITAADSPQLRADRAQAAATGQAMAAAASDAPKTETTAIDRLRNGTA
jgi:hypothetical protein